MKKDREPRTDDRLIIPASPFVIPAKAGIHLVEGVSLRDSFAAAAIWVARWKVQTCVLGWAEQIEKLFHIKIFSPYKAGN